MTQRDLGCLDKSIWMQAGHISIALLRIGAYVQG